MTLSRWYKEELCSECGGCGYIRFPRDWCRACLATGKHTDLNIFGSRKDIEDPWSAIWFVWKGWLSSCGSLEMRRLTIPAQGRLSYAPDLYTVWHDNEVDGWNASGRKSITGWEIEENASKARLKAARLLAGVLEDSERHSAFMAWMGCHEHLHSPDRRQSPNTTYAYFVQDVVGAKFPDIRERMRWHHTQTWPLGLMLIDVFGDVEVKSPEAFLRGLYFMAASYCRTHTLVRVVDAVGEAAWKERQAREACAVAATVEKAMGLEKPDGEQVH